MIIHDEAIQGAIVLDGLDKAVIGSASTFGRDTVVAYDYRKIIDLLVNRDGMSYDEAVEYFDFNIGGLSAGERNPVFINCL
tara:strand:- start:229 stop:471 length:243 start_codon:yes stop_codon:yes gene_type:complete